MNIKQNNYWQNMAYLFHGEVAGMLKKPSAIAVSMATPRWVVKAQVHAGGRGKAGGVKIVSTQRRISQAR